ncbi:ribonuclease H protein [Dorcoceras hygrometricum]|uniref:Ribonuclease H protein n=1 Tax=Dorcoceras hygrometricum TaxID=472368 RepID=A0A2Z7CHK8_9LAMI|nr:ribonuclease H protein [Dorcoceras hygrometricum]
MVVDLIGIYGLKGPYCTLTTTDWFLQALSVIPRGSWGDVARRFTMIRWAVLLVQPDEGVSVLVVDRIGDNLPQSTEKSRVLVIPVGARHKCQQGCLDTAELGWFKGLRGAEFRGRAAIFPASVRPLCPMAGVVVDTIGTGWTLGSNRWGSDQGWPEQGEREAASRVVVIGMRWRLGR